MSDHFGLTRCYRDTSNLSCDSTANGYRLPTEAEWEYAARGGKHHETFKYSGSNSLDLVAWYRRNSGLGDQPVGTKNPNRLEIYDMSGNVWEWCNDWYRDTYYDECHQRGIYTNPFGPLQGDFRVVRGGSWGGSFEDFFRCANRDYFHPVIRNFYLGFRVVRSAQS